MYKDNLEAAVARGDALEADNEDLKRKVEELEKGEKPPRVEVCVTEPPKKREASRGVKVWLVVSALCFIWSNLLAYGCYLTDSNWLFCSWIVLSLFWAGNFWLNCRRYVRETGE